MYSISDTNVSTVLHMPLCWLKEKGKEVTVTTVFLEILIQHEGQL